MLALELSSKQSQYEESSAENPAAQAVRMELTLMLSCLV